MICVAVASLAWHSIKSSTRCMLPKNEMTVVIATAGFTVWIHNPTVGVAAAVPTALRLFTNRVRHLATVERRIEEQAGENFAKHEVNGELFLASSNDGYTQV